MKVLGIVCSPRKGGNTEIMMNEALAGARSCGAETELWTTAKKELKYCDGCETCNESGKCHINDDMQELYPKIIAADGIIFGSPVYFVSITAQAKTVIDRLYCLYKVQKLAGKVSGVISSAWSMGHMGVRNQFNAFCQSSHMILGDHAWGYVKDKDVRKDKYAMKSSEILGMQIASLVKQQFQWPEEYSKPLYRLCKDMHGIDAYPLEN